MRNARHLFALIAMGVWLWGCSSSTPAETQVLDTPAKPTVKQPTLREILLSREGEPQNCGYRFNSWGARLEKIARLARTKDSTFSFVESSNSEFIDNSNVCNFEVLFVEGKRTPYYPAGQVALSDSSQMITYSIYNNVYIEYVPGFRGSSGVMHIVKGVHHKGEWKIIFMTHPVEAETRRRPAVGRI